MDSNIAKSLLNSTTPTRHLVTNDQSREWGRTRVLGCDPLRVYCSLRPSSHQPALRIDHLEPWIGHAALLVYTQ